MAGSLDPYVLCNKNNDFTSSRIQDPMAGSLDPYVLCNKNNDFTSSRIQDPIMGSCGSYCFARQYYSFADFEPPPRALIIILKRARGVSGIGLGGPLPELVLVL